MSDLDFWAFEAKLRESVTLEVRAAIAADIMQLIDPAKHLPENCCAGCDAIIRAADVARGQ